MSAQEGLRRLNEPENRQPGGGASETVDPSKMDVIFDHPASQSSAGRRGKRPPFRGSPGVGNEWVEALVDDSITEDEEDVQAYIG